MSADQENYELTEIILGCCFQVMNELGPGFLESVYKNALVIALRQKNLKVCVEQRFDVHFRGQKVGFYAADLVVEDSVILELKCCAQLIAEHQAQLINYLTASGMPTGLLVNFGNSRLTYKRLCHPSRLPVQAA